MLRRSVNESHCLDQPAEFMHGSFMRRTISIDDKAYLLLKSLKQNTRDSFTKVILRHFYRPADTCGELLEMIENDPAPRVNLDILNRVAEGRGGR